MMSNIISNPTIMVKSFTGISASGSNVDMESLMSINKTGMIMGKLKITMRVLLLFALLAMALIIVKHNEKLILPKKATNINREKD